MINKDSKVINSNLRGPCIIGNGSVLKNAFIGPYTSISKGAKIIDSTIEYSIVLENAQIIGVDRIEESLIGKNAKVTRSKMTGCFKLHVDDYSEIEL